MTNQPPGAVSPVKEPVRVFEGVVKQVRCDEGYYSLGSYDGCAGVGKGISEGTEEKTVVVLAAPAPPP